MTQPNIFSWIFSSMDWPENLLVVKLVHEWNQGTKLTFDHNGANCPKIHMQMCVWREEIMINERKVMNIKFHISQMIWTFRFKPILSTFILEHFTTLGLELLITPPKWEGFWSPKAYWISELNYTTLEEQKYPLPFNLINFHDAHPWHLRSKRRVVSYMRRLLQRWNTSSFLLFTILEIKLNFSKSILHYMHG